VEWTQLARDKAQRHDLEDYVINLLAVTPSAVASLLEDSGSLFVQASESYFFIGLSIYICLFGRILRVLTVVYIAQNHWVSGLCPSPGILNN
jgi:hypothetical protein